MKSKEEIEQLAKQSAQKKYRLQHIPLELIDEYGGEIASHVSIFSDAYTQCQKDMVDKKYTEEDIKKAIELARETERVTLGEEREAWDDIEKYDEMDIIYLLNKQD